MDFLKKCLPYKINYPPVKGTGEMRIHFYCKHENFPSSLTLFVCSWFDCPYLPPPPRLVLQSACFHTIKANPHPLHWGGAPVEISDASLTTSINHSPSDYLSPAPFCLSLYVSVSISLCLAYTTLISVSSLFPTHEMGTTYHKNTAKCCCWQERFIDRALSWMVLWQVNYNHQQMAVVVSIDNH